MDIDINVLENVRITIPESVTYIGYGAFSINDYYDFSVNLAGVVETEDGFVIVNNISIKYNGNDSEVTIPDGITQIYAYAFSGCENLSVINFPDSVTYFGADAFSNTPWLDNYPDDFVIVNNVLIKYKVNDPDVTIPYGVTAIGDGAFYQNISVENVIIPDGVTYIGELAFSDCLSLSYVYIPNSVTRIGYNAFCRTSNKMSLNGVDIKIPDSVTSIGAGAFWGANLKNAVIPKGVSYVGVLTFAENSGYSPH